MVLPCSRWTDNRAFSCDVTVTWKPYGRPFWCTVEWRLSMLHDVRAKCAQTWQLMDLPHKYVRYRYLVHVICETWAHWLHSSRLSHTSSYLLVHQSGRHAQKYHRVMQTCIIFNHVMKTLYSHLLNFELLAGYTLFGYSSAVKFHKYQSQVVHILKEAQNGILWSNYLIDVGK